MSESCSILICRVMCVKSALSQSATRVFTCVTSITVDRSDICKSSTQQENNIFFLNNPTSRNALCTLQRNKGKTKTAMASSCQMLYAKMKTTKFALAMFIQVSSLSIFVQPGEWKAAAVLCHFRCNRPKYEKKHQELRKGSSVPLQKARKFQSKDKIWYTSSSRELRACFSLSPNTHSKSACLAVLWPQESFYWQSKKMYVTRHNVCCSYPLKTAKLSSQLLTKSFQICSWLRLKR